MNLGEPGAVQGGTGQVKTGQVGTGQIKKRQVKPVQSVQVKMVKFYLGRECGPTQSYLFFSISLTAKFSFWIV